MTPPIFKRRFRIRHYECDAYGHLNNANYARFMQEAAIDASAAVGWDGARYQALGKQWLIRDTYINYMQAVNVNDVLEVATWVEDFRRVRSLRIYEFRKRNGDELVARAVTDWVFVDMETQRPVQPPDGMIEDFYPDYTPPEVCSRRGFPKAPPPPENVYTLHKRVEWRDIDQFGHMNNGAYFNYVEDATSQAGRHYGWEMKRLLSEGFAMIARDQRIQYRIPAQVDDEIHLATWISDEKRATFVRHYTFHRPADDALLARARVTWVCLDLNTMRPRRIPRDMVLAFVANATAESQARWCE